MKPIIRVLKKDITTLQVDAIVNAANPTLYGGGGVDGAIHTVAGPKLLAACKDIRRTQYPKGLPTGGAVITPGFNLPAKYVIHTVGPINGKDHISLLKNCYVTSLKLAEEYQCKSVAFPSISTGAYGVPIEKAVMLVKEVIEKYESTIIKEIILVLFNDHDFDMYRQVFKAKI